MQKKCNTSGMMRKDSKIIRNNAQAPEKKAKKVRFDLKIEELTIPSSDTSSDEEDAVLYFDDSSEEEDEVSDHDSDDGDEYHYTEFSIWSRFLLSEEFDLKGFLGMCHNIQLEADLKDPRPKDGDIIKAKSESYKRFSRLIIPEGWKKYEDCLDRMLNYRLILEFEEKDTEDPREVVLNELELEKELIMKLHLKHMVEMMVLSLVFKFLREVLPVVIELFYDDDAFVSLAD